MPTAGGATMLAFMAQTYESVDHYISTFPAQTRAVLEQARRAIHEAVPGLEEKITYQMPTFTRDGTPVIHLSGWKAHISIYPVPDLEPDLAGTMEPYLSGASTAKFPLSRPVPYELIGTLARELAAQR